MIVLCIRIDQLLNLYKQHIRHTHLIRYFVHLEYLVELDINFVFTAIIK